MRRIQIGYKINALVIAIMCCLTMNAQEVTDSNGLISLKMKTAHGTLDIYLPKNYIHNKPVSGTIAVKGNGDNAKAIGKNTKKLEAYKVKINDATFGAGKMSLTPKTNTLIVSVLDDKGKTIASKSMSMDAIEGAGALSFPKGIKSEGITQVYGNFDGDVGSTKISIGGQACTVLAESPVQTIFSIPKLLAGKTRINITDAGNSVGEADTQIVTYALSAGRLKLMKGENTYFQAIIYGLNFIDEPIPFIVKNLSPGVVDLEGGNLQTIMIPRQEDNYTRKWNISSKKTGSFTISTELILPATEFINMDGNIPAQGIKKDPCEEIKKDCDALLAALNKMKLEAKNAADKAAADKAQADALKKIADDLEAKAVEAEKLAIPRESGGTITMDNHTYHLIDSKMLDMLRQQAWADYQAGTLTNAQYQARLKELSGPEALKEVEKQRKALEKKLREEAAQARKKANDAKTAYQNAKAIADASARESAKKQQELAAAQKAYDACMKKVKDECDKILAAIAKADADRKLKLKQDSIAKAKAETIRLAELKKKEQKAARDEAIKKRKVYLLGVIKELGLLDSSGLNDIKVPEVWDFLEELTGQPMDNSAKDFLEAIGGGPIPLKTINAIGECYKLLGAGFDPCTKFGKEKTIKKLETMVNPNTGKNYEYLDALALTNEMCELLRELKTKLRKIKAARAEQ